MMPNDVWHRKTSIFSSPDSIIKEERDRRRILRIQQVRHQSKKIASQVVEKAKLLKKCEESKQKELKDKALKDWKQQKLRDLQNELDHGLETFGESHKAVEKELRVLKAKKVQEEESIKAAKERGSIAFNIEFAQREEAFLLQEKLKNDRENIRAIENQRAKAVASLPPCIKQPLEPEPSCKSEGTKVEVYNFSLPQHRRHIHFTTVPDDVVQKVEVKSHCISAKEEAAKEIAARIKKLKEQKSTQELTAWLGNAAESRKSLEKEYKSIFGSLKTLEQQELASRPASALPISELSKLERKLKRNQEKLSQKLLVKMAENRKDTSSPQPMDFTDFPGTQFTPEEAGALGPTAHSLQTLLDSLAGESRRRLEEVVGEDYYYYSDEDFATPPVSPDGEGFSIESSSKVQISSGAASMVSASSELSVTIKSGKHKKKKKKKNKRRLDVPDEQASGADAVKKQQSFLSTNSTQYMSPPDHLREDQIADYLARIEQEKEQLRKNIERKQGDFHSVNLPEYAKKLVTMTRHSVENLSVSDVTDTSLDQQIPSKKSKSCSVSSSSCSTLGPTDISDARDGLSNGQSSNFEEKSSYKDGPTAYLSLTEIKNKNPLDVKVQPDPGNSELLGLISAPAEPLVRPMEKLRLSTIAEADTSTASTAKHSDKSNASQSMDFDAEMLTRNLPLPKPWNSGSSAPPTGDEYLRRMQDLPKYSDSFIDNPPRFFHSTPVTTENLSDKSNGQSDSDLKVSTDLPSSVSDVGGSSST